MNGKSVFAAAAVAAALIFGPQGASAMPAASLDEAVSAPIEKTYGGCGINGHRGPYGGCRFGGQAQLYRYGYRRGYYGRPYYARGYYRRW